MKKNKVSGTSFISLFLSVITLVVVIAVGALIKRIGITVNLLILPILFGLISAVLSIFGLIKSEDNRLKLVIILIMSIIFTAAVIFLRLILIGLSMLT